MATFVFGIALKAIGLPDQNAAIVGCVACILVLVYEVTKYVRQNADVKVMSQRVSSRRSALAFSVFGLLDAVLFGMLENVGAAVAFGSSAKKSMENGEGISIAKAMFYRSILQPRVEANADAAHACAAITCAERYT